MQKDKTLFTLENFPAGQTSKDFAVVGPAGSLKGFLGVPLITGDRILGALVIFSFTRKSYLESEKQTLFTLGAYAALAIENSRQYEELVHLNRLKSDFIAVASHELFTPVTALKESISLILDGLAGSTSVQQLKLLEIAFANSERLNRLINNIIDISSLDLEGTLKLSKTPCNIKELLKNNIETLCVANQHKKIVFDVDFDSSFSLIPADPGRINLVLFNLLENAVKFSSDNGKIIIKAQKNNNEEVCFEIIDQGPGIPIDLHSMIFQPFTQSEPVMTRRTGGLGLGLALSKGIIEAHNGKIWVESIEGKGAKFAFTLPIE
jgi:signal transduction histidine kinase